MARAESSASSAQSTATIGFEAKWPDRIVLIADNLRNNADAEVAERNDQRGSSRSPFLQILPQLKSRGG